MAAPSNSANGSRSRFGLWLAARVPPSSVVFVLSAFLAYTLYARALAEPFAVRLSPRDALSFAAALAFVVFSLAVEAPNEGRERSPEAPGPVALVMALVQLGIVVTVGGGVGGAAAAWLLAAGYALLVGRRFFVPRWMHHHPFVRGVASTLEAPLFGLWIAQMALVAAPLPAGVERLLAAALLGALAQAFAVSRAAAARAAFLALSAGHGAFLWLSLKALHVPWPLLGFGVTLLAGGLLVLHRPRAVGSESEPAKESADQRLEAGAALLRVVGWLVVFGSIAVTRGLRLL